MKRRRGQAAVELALAFLYYAAFLLALADIARVTFAWASLQYAVNEAARYGSTGRVDEGRENREETIRERVRAACEPFGLAGVTVELHDGEAEGAGRGGSFFRLTARTTVTLSPVSDVLQRIAGDHSGAYAVSANTVIRNEPFV